VPESTPENEAENWVQNESVTEEKPSVPTVKQSDSQWDDDPLAQGVYADQRTSFSDLPPHFQDDIDLSPGKNKGKSEESDGPGGW
jgi:hypothetical protein